MKRSLWIILLLALPLAGFFAPAVAFAELDDPPWGGSGTDSAQAPEPLSGQRAAAEIQAPLAPALQQAAGGRESFFVETLRRWVLVSVSWVLLAAGLALVSVTLKKTYVWLKAVRRAAHPPTGVFNLQLQVRNPAGDFSLHNFDYYPIVVASHGAADLLLPSPLGQRDRFRIDYRQGQACLACDTPLIVNGVPRQEKALKEGDRILFGAYRLAFRDASIREQGAALPGKPVFAWQFPIVALLLALSVMFRQAGAEPRDQVLARARAGRQEQVAAAASSVRQAAMRGPAPRSPAPPRPVPQKSAAPPRPAPPPPAPPQSAAPQGSAAPQMSAAARSSSAAVPEAGGAGPVTAALPEAAQEAASKPAERPLATTQPAEPRPEALRPNVAQEAALRLATAQRAAPQPPAPQRAEPQPPAPQRAAPQPPAPQLAKPQPLRSPIPQPVALSRAGTEPGRVPPEPRRIPVQVVAPGRPIEFFQADVLFIHAHPDDESIDFGALMARSSRSGKRIVTLLFTDGESGLDLYPQRMIGDIYPARPLEGDALSQVRMVEAARALSILGSEVYLRWGLDNHAYNNKRDELAVQEILQAWGGEEKLLDGLIGILAGFRPAVVVSPDRPSAAYEHFEHEAVGYLVDKALRRLLREGGGFVKGHLVSVDPYQKEHYPGSIGIAALERDPESGLAYRAIQVQALKEHVTQRDAALIAVSRLNHLPLEFYWARFWELDVSVEEFFK